MVLDHLPGRRAAREAPQRPEEPQGRSDGSAWARSAPAGPEGFRRAAGRPQEVRRAAGRQQEARSAAGRPQGAAAPQNRRAKGLPAVPQG